MATMSDRLDIGAVEALAASAPLSAAATVIGVHVPALIAEVRQLRGALLGAYDRGYADGYNGLPSNPR